MTRRTVRCACGASVSPKTRSGRCARCANADPAVRARKGQLTPAQKAARAEAMRRLAADPEIAARRADRSRAAQSRADVRERHRQGCVEAKARQFADPEYRAKMEEAGRRLGSRNGDTLSEEARRRAGTTLRARLMSWCPEDLWPLNAELKRKGYRLPERQRLIQEEVDRRDPARLARRAIAEFDAAQQRRAARERAQRY